MRGGRGDRSVIEHMQPLCRARSMMKPRFLVVEDLHGVGGPVASALRAPDFTVVTSPAHGIGQAYSRCA